MIEFCVFPRRAAEATGGTEAHGRDAQSRDAEEEGNATEVLFIYRSMCNSVFAPSFFFYFKQ